MCQIEPYVVFGPGVTVRAGARIRAFSHLEGAEVGHGRDRRALCAAAARRASSEEDVHIGNFVEVKNARIEKGAKANHLTYLGDARVGAGANIGAGTITCNYDGFDKHMTDIGAGAFIGSDTALVAPVKVGDGAITGAGSVDHQGCRGRRAGRHPRRAEGKARLGGRIPRTEESGKGRQDEGQVNVRHRRHRGHQGCARRSFWRR